MSNDYRHEYDRLFMADPLVIVAEHPSRDLAAARGAAKQPGLLGLATLLRETGLLGQLGRGGLLRGSASGLRGLTHLGRQTELLGLTGLGLTGLFGLAGFLGLASLCLQPLRERAAVALLLGIHELAQALDGRRHRHRAPG